jgi:hypothetical protein
MRAGSRSSPVHCLQRWRVRAMLAIGLMTEEGATLVGMCTGCPLRPGETRYIFGRRGIGRNIWIASGALLFAA